MSTTRVDWKLVGLCLFIGIAALVLWKWRGVSHKTVEPFQTTGTASATPPTTAEAILLPKSSVYDSGNTYTIFDPEAAFVQAQINQIEYAALLDYMKSKKQIYYDYSAYLTSRYGVTDYPECGEYTSNTFNLTTLPFTLDIGQEYVRMLNVFSWSYLAYRFYPNFRMDRYFRWYYRQVQTFLNLLSQTAISNPIGFISRGSELFWVNDYTNYMQFANTYVVQPVTFKDFRTPIAPLTRYEQSKPFWKLGGDLDGKPNLSIWDIHTYFKDFYKRIHNNLPSGGVYSSGGGGCGGGREWKIHFFDEEPERATDPFILEYWKHRPATSILSSPNTWAPVLRLRRVTGQDVPLAKSIYDAFLSKKAGDPNKIMWQGIQVYGTITEETKEEIRKSISYSIYLNFSDTTVIDRQIRVSANDARGFSRWNETTNPYKIYMSPNFLARPEYTSVKVGDQYVLTLDANALNWNKVNCGIELTPEMLKLLPYHLRSYILNWANSRYERIMRLNELIYFRLARQGPPSFDITALSDTELLTRLREGFENPPTEGPIKEGFLTLNIQGLGLSIIIDLLRKAGAYIPDESITDSTKPGQLIRILRSTYTPQMMATYQTMSKTEDVYTDAAGTKASIYVPPYYEAKRPYAAAKAFVDFFAAAEPYTDVEKQTAMDVLKLSGTYGSLSPIDQLNVNTKMDEIRARTPGRTYLTRGERAAYLDQMAQLYYDKFGGTRRMRRILDLYQVGDTIFDVRYEDNEKTSAELRAQINTLTEEFRRARLLPSLTESQLLELETRYIVKCKDLYAKEEENIVGSDPNCGTEARYVRITLKKPASGGPATGDIKLSQVLVIDNRGENVALFASVTVRSVRLFDGEEDEGPVIRSDGTSPSDDDFNNSLRPLFDRNAALRETKLNSIVDGTLRLRVIPDLYYSDSTLPTKIVFSDTTARAALADTTDASLYSKTMKALRAEWAAKTTVDKTEFIEIDLGDVYPISAIRIIYPNAQTDSVLPAYTIELRKQRSDATPVATRDVDTTTPNTTVLFRSTTDTNLCPSDLINRYKFARFYASKLPSGQLTFTGFSANVTATTPDETPALSFNPRYNGGIYINIYSDAGNVNYIAKTQYLKNVYGIQELDTSEGGIKQILMDYRNNTSSQDFKARADIQALPESQQYISSYFYYPRTITGVSKLSPFTVGLRWEEDEVDPETNRPLRRITRLGKFVYKPDDQNWNSPQVIYDLKNSALVQDASALGALQTVSYAMDKPLPDNKMLDDAGGFCPSVSCSDTNVLNDIVGEFNDRRSSMVVTDAGLCEGVPCKITHVLKAATPASTQCDLEVVLDGATSQPRKMTALLDLNTQTCRYTPRKVTLGDGFFVQDNTPQLSKLYKYASDILRPWVTSFQSIRDQLLRTGGAQTSGSPPGILWAVDHYRETSSVAYGTVETLEGCPELDEMVPLRRCTNPAVVNAFMRDYTAKNPGQRIRKFNFAGAYSKRDCDFSFEVEDRATGAAQTVGHRCRMEKDPGVCGFSITTKRDFQFEEVYRIQSNSGATFTKDTANGICFNLGGRLATRLELANRNRIAAPLTEDGWLEELPWMVPDPTDPTNPAKQVFVQRPAIYCFGIRPSTSNLYTFSPSIVPTGLEPCRPITVTPTVKDVLDVGARLSAASTGADPSLQATLEGTRDATAPLLDLPAAPSVDAAPSNPAVSVSCEDEGVKAAFKRGSGYTALQSAGGTATTCEYRVLPGLYAPFQEQFKSATFYRDASGVLQLKQVQAANPATSPFAARVSATDATLMTLFRTEWNRLYYSSAVQPRKKVGKLYEVAAATGRADTLIYKANAAEYGGAAPTGTPLPPETDIRAYYGGTYPDTRNTPRYFKVVFRKSDSGALYVYSMEDFAAADLAARAGPVSGFTALSDSEPELPDPNTVTSFRYFRFTVLRAAGDPAQITRIALVKGSTPINLSAATVVIQDICGNYAKPFGKPCEPGYTEQIDPISQFRICKKDSLASYSKGTSRVCAIGYEDNGSGTCVVNTRAVFNGVYTTDPKNDPQLQTLNDGVPRLRLPVGKYLEIQSNDIVTTLGQSGFFFMTGSNNSVPLQWRFEGSMNRVYWKALHTQTTDFPYTVTNRSFYIPKIFFFDGTSTDYTQLDAQATVNNSRGIEGFRGERVSLEFAAPTTSTPGRPLYSQKAQRLPAPPPQAVEGPRRPSWLRFRCLETVDPASKFVHMSALRFYTSTGTMLPASTLQVSNPMGTRMSPTEGPDQVCLPTTSTRWIDYTKSPLLIRILEHPADAQITGFQFSVPSTGPARFDGLPSRWVLEASTDARHWTPLHEMKARPATFRGEYSPVYSFTQEI